MKKIRIIYQLTVVAFVFAACQTSGPKNDVGKVDAFPEIFPDYNQIVIPPNIAPLNFNVETVADAYFVKIEGKEGKAISMSSKSGIVDIPIKKWKNLLKDNTGKDLSITVSVKKEDKWSSYKPLQWKVANDEIDSYLAYRLINVGYVLWRKMGLYQRDLTSFDETPIMLNRNSDGNCMNCHSFSANNPDYMMFHMRGKHGGTVISTPDSVFKINSKTEYTLGAGGYPAWNADGKHIAFSIDKVQQFFHGVEKRNEVYDRASDLAVYNIEKNMLTTNPEVSTLDREVLPHWSPDGKYIYFGRAPQWSDTLDYDEVFYDLLRVEYDTENDKFGKLDTILLASDLNSTISFPKASPDGKYILFTRASHGYFTIFNSTADLYFLNLQSGEVSEYPYNSKTVDSFHTWSSNSRWVVFSSKRIDDLTTRPFITYIDENGKAYKPFVLPQKDPLFYKSFKSNYNVPELVKGPVKIPNQELLEAALGEAQPIKFDERVNVNALSGASSKNKKAGDELH